MVGYGAPELKCPKCGFEFTDDDGNYLIDLDDYRVWIHANYCPVCGQKLKSVLDAVLRDNNDRP